MNTRTQTRSLADQARMSFEAHVLDHQMTVLMDMSAPGPDQKPYRHLRFAKPGTSMYSFSLVTWPGHLALSGDVGSFTFSRLYDMADFFHGAGINPSYWGQKVAAGAEGVRTYSPERFGHLVEDHLTDDYLDRWNPEDQDTIRQAARRLLIEGAPSHIEEAREALFDFQVTGLGSVGASDFGFEQITDTYDLDLTDYAYPFLIACHAVKYGLDTYRAAFPDNIIREVS